MPTSMKTSKKTPFAQMERLSHEAQVYTGINSLLGWDQETFMPAGAAAIRAEQIECMASHIHKLKTSKKWKSALSRLIELGNGTIIDPTLTPEQQAAVKLWRRDFLKDTALPDKFVKEFAKITSQALVVWREARKENSFNKFAPFLERIVELNRRKANYFGFTNHIYDALLDEYEPGMDTATIEGLFNTLKPKLQALLAAIKAAPQIDNSCLYGHFDSAKQMELGEVILRNMGFDLNNGRLDLSTHPFSSSSHPSDSRVTTRISEEYILSNIAAVLHEGGHALYEMGLDPKMYGTPLGHSISMGMHESQSRWWETRIGLSQPFWKYFYPLLKQAFPGKFDAVPLEQFYQAIHHVQPSFIRVEADEVTYPLHVMLRFEMERRLIEGSLKIRDVPQAWNALMQELLGITPKDNKEGCLQDIHWSMGAFGYFPAYSLGNMYAAQLFDCFTKQNPNWEERVAKGDLAFVKEWLSNNVYRHGRRFDSQELVERITGQRFSAIPYAEYLDGKYRSIYRA